MKKTGTSLLLAAIVLLLAVSCKSTPDTGATSSQELLARAKTEATDSKAKAVGVKAEVAEKDLFAQAETEMKTAEELEAAGKLDEAAASYTTASTKYLAAFTAADAKRKAALEALGLAETDRTEAEKAIAEAEEEAKKAEGAAQ